MKRLDFSLTYVLSSFDNVKKRLAPFGFRNNLLHFIKQSLNLTQMNAKKLLVLKHYAAALMTGLLFMSGVSSFAADPCSVTPNVSGGQKIDFGGGSQKIGNTQSGYSY